MNTVENKVLLLSIVKVSHFLHLYLWIVVKSIDLMMAMNIVLKHIMNNSLLRSRNLVKK